MASEDFGWCRGWARLGWAGEALGQNPGLEILKTKQEARDRFLPSVWLQACS